MTAPPEASGTRERFPNPFELATPPGCQGWEEMYPYYTVFTEEQRAFVEGRFWFQDSLHAPEPFFPFDMVSVEASFVAFNHVNTRLFVVPQSLGNEWRLLNGLPYISPNSVTDEETLRRRAELFARRGGYYYEHWDALYARWVLTVEAEIHALEAIEVPELPKFEDEVVIREGGLGSSFALLAVYNRLLESMYRIWQHHFEFLNLGYGAYFAFYELCRQIFPDITVQTIAKMVTGIDVLVLKPDEELQRLARLALELGVAKPVRAAVSEDGLRAALAGNEAGARWLADFDETKQPWFNFSSGNAAWYHHHRSWNDDPVLPIATLGAYIRRLEAGESISRPRDALIAERERITHEYRSLIASENLDLFDQGLALARTVFPFVENHNFYIDHWYFTVFWNKVRLFGALLCRHRFLTDQEDIFYLRSDEVRSALDELRLDWSTAGAGAPRGPGHWPPIVERRKVTYEALCTCTSPPALGAVPESITEPATIMLWGITPERVQEWLSSSGDGGAATLIGVPGSPGIAEGRARVILRPDQLCELRQGEILVAPCTSTSWTPAFGTIVAAVLDSGGIMSHAAIVAREYGLPAVVGTGTGTKRIKTGDQLRVDADTGIVSFL